MKKRKDYNYYKTYPRDNLELFLDIHNHKLELIRTIGSVLGGIGGMCAILRLFGII